MTTVLIVVVVVIVLAALAGAGFVIARRRRSQQLQNQFGPEYDKVLQNSESKGDAESELAARKKRHDSLDLRSLDETTRQKYRDDWQRIQGGFVDDPGGAVEHADSLVTSIMRDRGYPLDDFDQRASDISVEHPRVVDNYREARRVHDAHRDGSAGTEDLRGAVTAYRNLVDALLDESGDDDRGGRGGDGGREGGRDGNRGDRGGDGRDRGATGPADGPGRGDRPAGERSSSGSGPGENTGQPRDGSRS